MIKCNETYNITIIIILGINIRTHRGRTRIILTLITICFTRETVYYHYCYCYYCTTAVKMHNNSFIDVPRWYGGTHGSRTTTTPSAVNNIRPMAVVYNRYNIFLLMAHLQYDDNGNKSTFFYCFLQSSRRTSDDVKNALYYYVVLFNF